MSMGLVLRLPLIREGQDAGLICDCHGESFHPGLSGSNSRDVSFQCSGGGRFKIKGQQICLMVPSFCVLTGSSLMSESAGEISLEKELPGPLLRRILLLWNQRQLGDLV